MCSDVRSRIILSFKLLKEDKIIRFINKQVGDISIIRIHQNPGVLFYKRRTRKIVKAIQQD